MSVTNYANIPNQSMKSYELNEKKSLTKKMEFCERSNIIIIERDSGKQVYVELQTIVYEYIKNNCMEFLAVIGDAIFPKKPIKGKDQKEANVEIQYFCSLKTSQGVPYSVTFKLYHTNCTMFVQNYGSNNDICLPDGRFSAKAFCEDYLIKAINLIENRVNISEETRTVKASLSKYL